MALSEYASTVGDGLVHDYGGESAKQDTVDELH